MVRVPKQPKPKKHKKPRCWFGKHDWNQYHMEALAPNENGAYRPAELVIMSCDRCGKVD